LKNKDFKPEEEVILEEDFRVSDNRYQVSGIRYQEKADILKYEPGEIIIEAETNAPRFLVLSDTYYPGWKVYADGKQGRIYRADYILRAVFLETGRHIVKFKYEPFSFRIGVVITLLTIIAIIMSLRGRRPKQSVEIASLRSQ